MSKVDEAWFEFQKRVSDGEPRHTSYYSFRSGFAAGRASVQHPSEPCDGCRRDDVLAMGESLLGGDE